MRNPLDGIRILDFTWAGAGPYATLVMALYGAEVIKVENHAHPDTNRTRDPSSLEKSWRFNDLNINKMSVTMDLSNPEARELVQGLAQACDVVIQNFRPGVMARLGADYPSLASRNPSIIMVSSSSRGSVGPERDYLGFASIFAALSGLSYVTGYDDGPPVEMRLPMDFASGVAAAMATMVGLQHRFRTGKGQHIDLASAEVPSASIGEMLIDYTMNGRVQPRKGNQDGIMAPCECYPCKGEDMWVSIAVADDAEWKALCGAIGRRDMLKDARFADQLSRFRHRKDLDGAIGAWTVKLTPWQATERLQKAGVAATPVCTAKDVFEDEHLKKRRMYSTVMHPFLGKQAVMNAPFKLTACPDKVRRYAPLMGEHNMHVFHNLLGLPQQRVEDLIERKVLY